MGHMRLEREGATGLALAMPTGERWLVMSRGVQTYLSGANDWSGERGRWTEASLHREGASLVVRLVEIVDHEGGTDVHLEGLYRSDDEGRTWILDRGGAPPTSPAIAELSTDLARLERLGDFRIIRRLGEGSLGVLHEAFDADARRVAVRVLALREEPEARAALTTIGPRLIRAQHPHLLRVHAVTELPDGRWLVARDFAFGETLERAPVAPDRAAFVASAVLGALEALHAEGIVHGDVQPGAIFFDHGRPSLADAALGLALGDRRGRRRTSRGVRIDLAYAPPELLERRPLDARSDVYAVGACLYEMLAGQAPFASAQSSVALGVAVVTGAPLPLDTSKVSPALAAVVARAMQKRPEDRFPTAAAMRAALGDA